MITVALVLTMQTALPADVAGEFDRLGRVSAIAAACSSIGYEVDNGAVDADTLAIARRAIAAQWAKDQIEEVLQTAFVQESDALGLGGASDELASADRVRIASEFQRRVKLKCRILAAERPDIIADVQAGELAADEWLAEIKRDADSAATSADFATE